MENSKKPQSFHCLDLFAAPPECLSLDDESRQKVVQSMTQSRGPEGFKPNELATHAPITTFQHLVVVCWLFGLMGLPLLWSLLGFFIFFAGTWFQLGLYSVVGLVLSMHPLPNISHWYNKSPLTLWLYRYFSYRFVWSDDAMQVAQATPRWVGAGVPHGVMPFANLLSIPAINTFGFRSFVGAPASVVFRTPFLRYLTLFGCVDVGARGITAALQRGQCVGLVADGVAGIFRTNDADEVVYMANRKGLAKLALRTGAALVPAYSMGNTVAFSAWFDRWGLMEWASRKARASLFLYWGRFGLPIPHRARITMVVGKPIPVAQVQPQGREPTKAEIDAVHAQLLQGIRDCFDTHKAALGWGHRNIRFV